MKDGRKTTQMIISLVAGMALSTAAATRTWTGGNWSDPANWSDQSPPASSDSVVISNTGAAGTIFNVDAEGDYVEIAGLTLGASYSSPGNSFVVIGKPIKMSGNVIFRASGPTISNDIIVANATWSMTGSRSGGTASATFAGNIAEATENLVTTFQLGGNYFNVTFTGAVNLPNASLMAESYSASTTAKTFIFRGPVRVRELLNNKSDDERDRANFNFYSTGNQWTTLRQGKTSGGGRFLPCCANAFPDTTVVTFSSKSADASSGEWVFDMFGFNQTIDRIEGPSSGLCHVRSTTSPAGGATTLALKGTADATAYANIQNNITLVYCPTGNFTQTFLGAANTTSGDIIVSNGTFRIGGTSSFANVKRIVVADGARFELLTETANALAGVTNIVLGANSHFAITNATTPFVDNAVSLEMTATSSFDLPDGADYLFAAAKVDGTPLDGGTYTGDGTVPQFKGSGSITIPDIEMPTVSATWDGGGADEGIGTDANWDGDATPALNAKSLYPLFAAGGDRALVDRALDFKGLHFGGSSASFSLVSNSPSASLTLRQSGIAVDASHTATIDVPVTIKNDQTWNVGSGGTLRFAKPVASAYDYSVSQIGHGMVRLDAPNGFRGAFNIGSETEAGGVLDVYAPTNALGPATDEPLTIWQSGNGAAGGAHGILRLRGTVIERPVTFKGTGNQYYTLDVYGTNTLTRPLNVYGHFRPRLNAGSNLVLAGGGRLNYSSQWLVPEGPGAFTFGGGQCAIAYISVSFSGRFNFNAEVSCGTIDFAGNGQMHVNAEGALYTQVFKCNSARIIMDLHGHDIRCGRFDPMNAGIFTSDAPALVHLESQYTTITNRAVRFTGKAGLEMKGNGAVVITNAMESAGPVRVAGGRLRFTASGSWSNSADIGVSGTGRLIVSQPKTFAKNAVFSFADSGVLEIPAGVTLRASQMLVGGVPVKDGMYGSATSPASNKSQAAHFAGNGTLLVGKLGTILSLR